MKMIVMINEENVNVDGDADGDTDIKGEWFANKM